MQTPEQAAQQIFAKKQERRKELALLSIEEKIKILICLQNMVAPILMARGIKKVPWIIS